MRYDLCFMGIEKVTVLRMRASHPTFASQLTDEQALTSDNNERDSSTGTRASERERQRIFFGDGEARDEYTVTHGPHPSEARLKNERFASRVRIDARVRFLKFARGFANFFLQFFGCLFLYSYLNNILSFILWFYFLNFFMF